VRRKRVDSAGERLILTGLITSKHFLAQAAGALETELTGTPPFVQIARWCLDYFNEYREAPKDHIESIFESWTEGRDEDDLSDAIGDLLEDLGEDQNGNTNVPYLLDLLNAHLSKKRLDSLKNRLELTLGRGDHGEAEQSVLRYQSVKVGGAHGIDPFRDFLAWDRAFEDPAKPLISFGSGPAGRFLNQALTRDSLIGIQGPEKRGKTWWCYEFVIRGLRNRLRVAFFQVGDMSEVQAMLRLGVRLAGRPLRKDDCGNIDIPKKIKVRKETDPETGKVTLKPVLTTDGKKCPRPLTKGAALRSLKKFMRSCGINKDSSYLKISIHANSSINVRGIEAILERWELEEGFVPDMIVIDYADILAPEDQRLQGRDITNEQWKALRRLSQEKHALVIVPTQADAESYHRTTQSMSNFSEDKRKLSHVTGMLGLNQTEEEKDAGVMRLNWIVLRESYFNARHCLWVGQCLTLGRAFCCAAL